MSFEISLSILPSILLLRRRHVNCHNCGGFVFCILPSLCGTDYEKVVFLFLSGTDLATVEASQVQNESTRFVNGGTHLCLFVELLRAVQH